MKTYFTLKPFSKLTLLFILLCNNCGILDSLLQDECQRFENSQITVAINDINYEDEYTGVITTKNSNLLYAIDFLNSFFETEIFIPCEEDCDINFEIDSSDHSISGYVETECEDLLDTEESPAYLINSIIYASNYGYFSPEYTPNMLVLARALVQAAGFEGFSDDPDSLMFPTTPETLSQVDMFEVMQFFQDIYGIYNFSKTLKSVEIL